MNTTFKILDSYDHLIDVPNFKAHPRKDIHISKAPAEIKKITLECYKQVEKLSKHLYDPDTVQFAWNILVFCRDNFIYKEDDPAVDQYREPARAWADRATGIDCDCFTIFINSILLCAGINSQSIEVGRFGEDYSHIYAAIGAKRNSDGTVTGGIVIDPVQPTLTIFEHPDNITKTQITNILVSEKLSGLKNSFKYLKGLSGFVSEISPVTQKLINYQNAIVATATAGLTSDSSKLSALMPYMKDLNKLSWLIGLNGEVAAQRFYLTLSPYISNVTPSYDIILNNDPGFNAALGSLFGMDISDFIDNSLEGLGKLKLWDRIKKVVDKAEAAAKDHINKLEALAKDIKNAVDAAAKKALEALESNLKKVWEKTVEVAKKGIHLIAKFFPATLISRAAFLVALNKNMFNLAAMLSVGSGTLQEAKAKDYTEDEYNKIKSKFDRSKELWDKLGGEESNLINAINKGKDKKPVFGNGKLNGLGNSSAADADAGGDSGGSSTADTIKNASGIIAGIVSLFSSIKGLFKQKDKGPSDSSTTTITYPHTNDDGSVLLNKDGDILYSDGDKYIAKPPTGKPYILKKDGTKEFDQAGIDKEILDQKQATDYLKDNGDSGSSKTIWYVGVGIAAALTLFIIFN